MNNDKIALAAPVEVEPVAKLHVGPLDTGPFHIDPTPYGWDHLKDGDHNVVLQSDAASVIAKLERKVDYWRDLAKEKDKQLAAKDAEIAKFESLGLTVWFGSMPESCGRENWTVMLSRKSAQDGAEESVVDSLLTGVTVCRSEYKDRMRYEADRLRFLLGEIDKEPWILDYDADLHSGYQYPPSKEVANLREQLAAAEKDAARYRAHRHRDFVYGAATNEDVYNAAYDLTCDYLIEHGAAIDAMKGEQK